MGTAPRLREVVAASVAAGENRIVVDLSDADFIDSAGLCALIGGLKATRQAGGDLRIAAPNEQVRLVLRLTDMERVLTAHPAAESAFNG
jgi:anti-sigma B factor antagonist